MEAGFPTPDTPYSPASVWREGASAQGYLSGKRGAADFDDTLKLKYYI